MKVQVDRSICVGHGRCQEFAPEVYTEDERGHCLIEREEIPPELEERARLGAGNCPEKAITIFEDEVRKSTDDAG